MNIPYFHIDAFTDQAFRGNPAAVCLLHRWLKKETMQAIAAEFNLSETAFLVPVADHPGRYELRWFTPAVEVDLCGHATLAAAFVVFRELQTDLTRVEFETASGTLGVERDGTFLFLDFPSRPPRPVATSAALTTALGIVPQQTLLARDLLVVLDNEEQVRTLRPDFRQLAALEEAFGYIVTAPGREVDFVSRFFAPNAGVDEDPVTGSAHSTLIPYWAKRLGKARLLARQLSHRGGSLICEDRDERVRIGGEAVLFAKGEITLPG